jgi:transposase
MASGVGVHVVTTVRRHKGRVYRAHLLRRSYRQDGKVKKETLANLTPLGDEVVAVIRLALQGQQLFVVDDLFQIVENGSRPHGHVQAVLTAMKRLGVAELIGSRRSRERDLVVAMIATRILESDNSKLATTRWWRSNTLAEELGVDDADEDELYAAMDWLLQRQSAIEKKLAARHLEADGLALYDLTSSYFEGVTCPLAKLGFNRDGKKGKLQVNYGLLTNRLGIPVAVSVFKGNTSDTKTLLPQVSKVQDEFGIERFVLVGDRGMIMQKQIDALREIEGVDWITALRTEAIRKLVVDPVFQMELLDERNLFELGDHPDFKGERLVACRNPELAKRRAHKRQALLDATVAELQTVQKMVQRGRLRGRQAIAAQLHKAVSSSKLGRHVGFEVSDDGFEVIIDEDKVVAEVTHTTVAEVQKVRRAIERGRLQGKPLIAKRLERVVARRKMGKHFHFEVSGDGFDFTIDTKAVVAETTAPLQRKLDKVRKRVEQGQLYGEAIIGVRVGKVVNKYKVGKHFVLDICDNNFDFTINEDKVKAEATLDGIYVIRTSLPKDRMDSADTVRSYKALTQVERAFRSMKTVDLKVRPIRHHLEDRVRAHIFLCLLAYYVEWHMIAAWRPLLFCDEDQQAKASRDPVAPAKRSTAALAKAASKSLADGSVVHSFHTLLHHLSAIVRNICRRTGAHSDEATFTMNTPPNTKQRQALDLLKAIEV